jgi:hypothetical protein
MTMRSALIVLVPLLLGLGVPASAAEEDEAKGVGYGGAKVQMQPLMVPTRAKDGSVRFEVLTVRLILDAGARERPACFSIPIVHEKMLMYLYKANLTSADLDGPRLEVLANNLLDVAIKTTAKGYYAGIEIVDESSQAMDPKSQTLSNQCK